MKVFRAVLLLILCMIMFFFLRGCYNRHEVKGIVEDYLDAKYYKGVTFKVGTPTKGLFAIMGPSNYSAPVTAVMEGRRIPFLVTLDEHWAIRYENFVERKFMIEIQDYIGERINPIIANGLVGANPTGALLKKQEDPYSYYLSPLEKVIDRLSSIGVSISWSGMVLMDKQEFYDMCIELAKALQNEPITVFYIYFRYSSDNQEMSLYFHMPEYLEAAPEQVLKKISVLNKISTTK
ncbi:MAG: hypothetical protein K0R57_3135 [Paenibacillaceae bacterium]|jgi:hypothetical protein|nr:hypothetical protein [Paenibacillaceae bacterium]